MIVFFWMMYAVDAQTYLAIQGLRRMAISIITVCVINTICVKFVLETFLLCECLCGNDFCEAFEAGCL